MGRAMNVSVRAFERCEVAQQVKPNQVSDPKGQEILRAFIYRLLRSLGGRETGRCGDLGQLLVEEH